MLYTYYGVIHTGLPYPNHPKDPPLKWGAQCIPYPGPAPLHPHNGLSCTQAGMGLNIPNPNLIPALPMCSSCADPTRDLGDPVSIAGHSDEWLQLLHFSGLKG